jgi:hypothetical protein
VDVTFKTRPDGQVDAYLSDEWRVFNAALGDSISSLPPRGARGVGPSTYWINVAEDGARRCAESGDEKPFTCGNITLLRVRGEQVIASFEFDDESEPGEAMPLGDFLSMLTEWRERVIESASKAVEALPETYRRNPQA